MVKKLDFKVTRRLNKSLEERLYICEREPLYFFIYYFSQYLTYPIAAFHYDFFDDIKGLTNGTYDSVAWIAFRESAKTSIAKLALVVWSICFNKKHYVNVDSFMKEDAEAFLFDVAIALQTNPLILRDFGNLYFGGNLNEEGRRQSKIKRLNNFITENDIKLEAFSTQQSTRGRVYKHYRPDMYVLDDFETNKTKDSVVMTNAIISHIDELKSGLGVDGSVLYLGNMITESGSVAHILKLLEKSKRAVVRNIPVSVNGIPTWKGKYVMTDSQAREVNRRIKKRNEEKGENKPKKISLQAKRRFLGDKVFETEMMNNPEKSGDLVFDRRVITPLIEKAEDPINVIAGLKLWAEHNPKHRYGQGGDTSEGIGEDASALVVIDFSRTPALVVATLKDNKIPPDIFAYDLKRAGNMFGGCITAPEINNTGFATLATLKDIYDNIYIREAKEKIGNIVTNKYGFRMTAGNKADIIYKLRSAIEDGDLEILDKDLLLEMKYYTKQQFRVARTMEGMTQHFDLLIACFVEGTNVLTDKGQKPIETISVGDKVMTRNGYKRVISIMSRLKKVISNIGLTGTPDHPIICADGSIQELQSLGNNDKLYVWNTKKREIENMSFTEAQNIADTQKPKKETIESILWGEPNGRNQLLTYIGKFGKIILELSQKVLSYIIKMATQAIMSLKTLFVYLLLNICEFIWENQNERRKSEISLTEKIIEQNKRRAFKSIIELKLLLFSPVRSVVKNIKQLQTTLNIVQPLVKINKPIKEGENQKQSENVLSVEKGSQQVTTKNIAQKVVSVCEEGSTYRKVYNLEVEDTPEYFANNILVHNCAIAWEMRDHAQLKTKKKAFVQPEYIPQSEYEGR